MKRYFCPLSIDASHQIKELTESYRLAIAAATDYNGIALANRKQVEAAIARADRLGEVIDCYLNGWQCGVPCYLFSCGWESCRRGLEILGPLSKFPIPPRPIHPIINQALPNQSTTDQSSYDQSKNSDSNNDNNGAGEEDTSQTDT